MRQFVVVGHEASTDPDLPLDDLPGAGGRFDVLCRCVNAAFLLSHGIREEVRCILVIGDRISIRLEGAELRYLTPDERNIASLLTGALQAAERAVGHQEVESTPGIYASKRGFDPVIDQLEGPVIQLHEDGDPLTRQSVPESVAFVLSDHIDFTGSERALLDESADGRVSVGPKRLHADHAITVAHNYLDTDGYQRYRG